jgi:hypothetical protein
MRLASPASKVQRPAPNQGLMLSLRGEVATMRDRMKRLPPSSMGYQIAQMHVESLLDQLFLYGVVADRQ